MKSALALVLVLTLVAACTSIPPQPPEDLAASLIEDLDNARGAAADERFARVQAQADYTDRLYPLLFQVARERYEGADPAQSVEVLRFMARHYPEARSVHEALLYSLFLVRGKQEQPDPELVREMSTVASALHGMGGRASAWLLLIDTQQAIDEGRLPDARTNLGAFVDAWNGEPQSLITYVEDLERYLSSH